MTPLADPRAPRPGAPPAALHDRAADDLRFIRSAIEGAARFTSVSGPGLVGVGLIAALAAALAARQPTGGLWLATWLATAALALAIAVATAARKARRAPAGLLSRPGLRFILGLTPPLAAGAILTPLLFRAAPDALPGAWALLYGAGLTTGGAASTPIVPAMGLAFMAVGAAVLAVPALDPNLAMALAFGALHVAFGLAIGSGR